MKYKDVKIYVALTLHIEGVSGENTAIQKRGPHLPSDFTNCDNTLLLETPERSSTLEADEETFASW